MIVRELEKEIAAVLKGQDHREQLNELVCKKELLGDVFNQLRLMKTLSQNGKVVEEFVSEENLNRFLAQLLMVMETLDGSIGEMLQREGENFNQTYGIHMTVKELSNSNILDFVLPVFGLLEGRSDW